MQYSLMTLVVAACTSSDPMAAEGPIVVHEVTQECGAGARLVKDVCTQAGPADGCVVTGDACIALCDGASSCSVVSDTLKALSLWPVAPSGYCVVCVEP